MASYLGDYPGARKSPESKFLRAVRCYKKQTHPEKELIIVSDGCPKTNELFELYHEQDPDIKLVKIPKQPLYSGAMRNAGLDVATGDIIAYLDADDAWGNTHLETIVSQFGDDVDFVYYDDFLVLSKDFKKLQRRHVETRFAGVGTSSICHRNVRGLRWGTGYGHDWVFVLGLAARGMRFKKLEKSPQYLVCHWGGEKGGDF